MARKEDLLEHLLEQFRAQILAFDEESLAVASSKGLVRRAKKELQKGAEPTIQKNTEGLVLAVDDQQVSISSKGLLETTCTCPATDVCRHILVSCLWLRSQLPTDSPDAAASPPQMPTYSLEELITWASKPILKKAVTFAQRNTVQIELPDGADAIIVRFPQANITCRYFPGTALVRMLCSCKAHQVCLHRVAAILAILKSQGTPIALPENNASDTSAATTASASEIIARTIRLLENTIAVGLLHLSDISHQQFVTLAVSAQAVKLPRLALALRGIASDIELMLQRHAAADSDRLFDRMAHTYALAVALETSAPNYPLHLAGQSQSRYDDVGTLQLIGMGAYAWRTRSGYGGITVLFWESAAQQWCSWSNARPLFHDQRFDPARAYLQPLPWEGIPHPAEASQHHIRLYHARRNHQQRLSSSQATTGTTLQPTGPADWQSIPLCFRDWQQLHHHVVSKLPTGLVEGFPLDRFVVIQPTEWGDQQFDPINQLFTWKLLDINHQVLFLRVQFSETEAKALEQLENLNPEKMGVTGVIGAMTLEQGTLYCKPIALCQTLTPDRSTIVNLYFSADKSADKKEKNKTKSTTKSEESELLPIQIDTESALDPVPMAVHTPSSIDRLTVTLQCLAEQGHSTLQDIYKKDLVKYANHADRTGMATLAKEVRQLIQPSQPQTSQLLKVRYLCYLYQQAADRAG